MGPGQFDPEDTTHKEPDDEGSTTKPLDQTYDRIVSSSLLQPYEGCDREEDQSIARIPKAHPEEEHEEGGDEHRLV